MYEVYCEKMKCKMSAAACIKRQNAVVAQEKRRGWSGMGRPFITTDECLNCEKGKEIREKMEEQAEYKTTLLYVPDVPEGFKVCNRPDCAHAGKPQPITSFDKAKKNKDGLWSYCKSCRRKMGREKYRSKHPAANPKPYTLNPKPDPKQPAPDNRPPIPEPSTRDKLMQKFIAFQNAGSSLAEAYKIINGERQDSYGNPENSFSLIAEFWQLYIRHRFGINVDLKAIDTAHMMTLFKMARMLGQAPCRDNYIDAQGYLAIAADRLLGKT